jgi:RNAse (barnase) inhibitor barstar
MKEIILSGAGWRTDEDFYSAFLEAVGAPGWHGHNLDALYDSISCDDINELETPYRVRISGASSMSAEARRMVESFAKLVAEMRKEGIEVSVVCEP